MEDTRASSRCATAEKDLGLFGMGNDIFKIPAAIFALTSSKVARPRVVLPPPSVKQAELVKETKFTPTPPLDRQGEVGLVEDGLFDDNSMGNYETIAEDVNAIADTETQSQPAAEYIPEPQN